VDHCYSILGRKDTTELLSKSKLVRWNQKSLFRVCLSIEINSDSDSPSNSPSRTLSKTYLLNYLFKVITDFDFDQIQTFCIDHLKFAPNLDLPTMVVYKQFLLHLAKLMWILEVVAK